MPSTRPGLDRRRRSPQVVEFVGRQHHIDRFKHHLGADAQDETQGFRNVLNVYGQGGVGKTWLLRQFASIAAKSGAAVATVDGDTGGVPQALGRMAHAFSRQGHPLSELAQRYDTYRTRLREIELDPAAPMGVSLRGRRAGRPPLPGLELASPLLAGSAGPASPGPLAISPDDLAAWSSAWTSYLATRFKHPEDVDLLTDPVTVLTGSFARDLMALPPQVRPVLMFDTYERTAVYLDRWLRDLLNLRYGTIPLDVMIVVAGRYELGKDPQRDPAEAGGNPWSDLRDLVERLPVEPFTAVEAQDYLQRRGITNPQIVAVILELSGNLPLLLDTLADESPEDPSAVGDPSGTAVERFLRWIDDPQKRQAALLAAFPLSFNVDVLSQLVDPDQADALFTWLEGRPFVEGPPGARTYSRPVREQMLRYQHQRSQDQWRANHTRLAEFCQARLDDLGLDERRGRQNDEWQDWALRGLYHRLCADARRQRLPALQGFLAAANAHQAFARRWAGMLIQAGLDDADSELERWGQRLTAALHAGDESGFRAAVAILSDLADLPGLDSDAFASVLGWRGRLRMQLGQADEAEKDLSTALALDDRAAFHLDRGLARMDLSNYGQAIEDFDDVLGRDPFSERALVLRGVARFMHGQYEQAVQDFSGAIDQVDDDPRLYNMRGQAYIRLQRYDDALADLDRAQALGLEDTSSLLTAYASTYLLAGRYPEALAAVDRLVAQDPENLAALALKLNIYQRMGALAEAAAVYAALASRMTAFLQQLRQMRDEVPADMWEREMGLWMANMGLAPEEAQRMLDGFNQLMAADPDRAEAMVQAESLNGQAVGDLQQGHVAKALEAIDRALALDEKPNYWLVRSLVHVQQQALSDALADLDRAIALDNDFTIAWVSRGDLYQLQGDVHRAVADYTEALKRQPENAAVRLARAQLLAKSGKLNEALEDVDRIIRGGPEQRARALALRGDVLSLQEKFTEALAAVDEAIDLEPGALVISGTRLAILRRMGDFDALAKGLAAVDAQIARFVDQYYERVESKQESLAKQGVVEWVVNLGLPPSQVAGEIERMLAVLSQGHDAAIRRMQAELAIANARAHADLGQADAAIAAANRAVELQPDAPEYRLARAEVSTAVGDTDAALADLEHVLKADPAHVAALTQQAALLRKLGRWDEALAAYDRWLQAAPDDPAALAGRGETLRLQGHPEQALAYFDRALQLRPDFQWAISSRGEAYQALGRLDDALADFSANLDANPDYLWALIQRGDVLRLLGRAGLALKDYQHALALAPESVAALFGQGECQRLLGHPDEALASFDKAAALNPKDVMTLAGRGETYRSLGRYEEAAADLDAALTIWPDYAYALWTRGLVYLLQRQYAGAATTLERALELDPSQTWLWPLQAQALRNLGRLEEARAVASQALAQESPGSWPFYVRALIRRRQGDTAGAQEDLARALELGTEETQEGPDGQQTLLNLALYHLAAGQPNEASELADRALVAPVPRGLLNSAIVDLEELAELQPDDAVVAAALTRLQARRDEQGEATASQEPA